LAKDEPLSTPCRALRGRAGGQKFIFLETPPSFLPRSLGLCPEKFWQRSISKKRQEKKGVLRSYHPSRARATKGNSLLFGQAF